MQIHAESNQKPNSVLNHLFRWQFAGSIYLSALQLICLIILGQFMGYKEMGIYTIFQIIFRFGMAVFDPGMFVSIIQKTGINQKIISKERKIQFYLLGICTLVISSFYLWEHQYLQTNPWIAGVSILLLLTIGLGSYYPTILIHHLKQRQISIIQMLSGSLEFIIIVSAIWFVDPIFVFSIGLLFRLIFFYAACWVYSKRIPQKQNEDQSLNEHISFSSYQVLNQGISFVQGNFDTVLVGSVFGLIVLGPYNIASEFSYLLFSKINPVFNKAIFPLLAKYQSDQKHRQEIIRESLLSHALVCITIYLIVYANLKDLVPFLFKDPELKILMFSRFIVIMAMIRSVNNIVFNQLLALGESGRLLKWNIVVLLINYLFITIIYFTRTDIYQFLIINIVLSFSVFIYTIQRLLLYYQEPSQFYKPLIKYSIFLLCCVLFLLCLSELKLTLWYSFISSFIGLACLLYLFYKSKLMDLVRLRIM